MRPILPSVILFIVLSLLAGLVQAAPPGTPEEKLYQIDVLVFARDEPAASDEAFRAPRQVEPGKTIEPIESPDSKLAPAAAELAKGGNLRVLAHKSWTQGAEEKKDATPARIHTTGGQLDGTVHFYVSRFLHVDVDLQLLDPLAPGIAYHLTERRRIKSQETHYFDHPRFGLLLQVTPIKAPAGLKR